MIIRVLPVKAYCIFFRCPSPHYHIYGPNVNWSYVMQRCEWLDQDSFMAMEMAIKCT